MKYLVKIFHYTKPYKLRMGFSLICSLLFVLLNAISIWMIGTLLSTILNPKNINNSVSLIDKSPIIIKFENIYKSQASVTVVAPNE